MPHYVVTLTIDVFDMDTPDDAAKDMAYWLLEETGAKRAVYEVTNIATNETTLVDLEEIGYNTSFI